MAGTPSQRVEGEREREGEKSIYPVLYGNSIYPRRTTIDVTKLR